MREERQREAAEAWVSNGWGGIIHGCCGFGKTRVGVYVMQAISAQKVLIAFPRNDIKQSWVDEFVEMGFSPIETHWSTFASLKGVVGEYNLIIVDEIHEASKAQLKELGRLVEGSPILGLTGTMTGKTEDQILREVGIHTCYHFPIKKGVEEGIICDYDIYVHEVELDGKKTTRNSKGKMVSEKDKFRGYQHVAEKSTPTTKRFMELKMIGLLQGSVAKLQKTKDLLNLYEEERILVFCGLKEVADSLGIPVYHSGDKDEDRFKQFCRGELSKLATIKLVQAGINIKPINRGVVNYLNGNPETMAQKIGRFLRMESLNPDKKAQIHIISSTEGFERIRVATALQFFEQNKIHYV